MNTLTLRDLNLENRRVLVRVDFNVPLNEKGEITDDTRIKASLPTIRYILDKGGRVILMSHLGRPKGKDPALSLKPCATRLSELLHKDVALAPDCVGPEVEKLANSLKNGEILLLENLRFHSAEEKPESDPSFAEKLSKLGDIYVNDAFGTAHRAHSSTATITRYFPGLSAAGFLLEKEIQFLGSHFANPQHPFYAIIGGAKISTKLGVLTSLLAKVDALFIGGAMAYTFFKAEGIPIGNSLYEEELIAQAKKFMQQAKIPIFLPKDLVIADKSSHHKVISVTEGIPEGWEGVDIGPLTRHEWANTLRNARMVFWNGPVGIFEKPPFDHGTRAIAEALAKLNATTIVGGGDSVAAINQLGLENKFTHISTGGGATLEYIEYGHLPGIDALSKKQ